MLINKQARIDATLAHAYVMGWCPVHEVYEGRCSQGIVNVPRADFERAYLLAMTQDIDDSIADRPLTDKEIQGQISRLAFLFVPEHWVYAPPEFRVTFSPIPAEE